MATHIIRLTAEGFEGQRVGNSMSTFATWQPVAGNLTVFWKHGQETCLRCNIGDKVQIQGGGGEVRRMIAPTEQLARAAWERSFFKGKRHATLEGLRSEAEKITRYDRPRGFDVAAVRVYVSDRCAIAYKAAMDGWVGVPWGWWAAKDCSPAELSSLIDSALGRSALHEYT